MAGDVIGAGKISAGRDVINLQRVALFTVSIGSPQQPSPVTRGVERTEREKGMSLGQFVAVKQHCLARNGHSRLDRRWFPVSVCGSNAAVQRVLLAFLGSAVIPPVALAHGHTQV